MPAARHRADFEGDGGGGRVGAGRVRGLSTGPSSWCCQSAQSRAAGLAKTAGGASLAKLLTVTEAAARLGVHRSRIQQLIEAGRLKAEKLGPVYMIMESDLKAVRFRPVGRPRKDNKK